MLTSYKNLTPEDVVKSHWTIESQAPIVSVICITYNHKKYIDRCLTSILSQKTKFPFEIVIHDDNSTDGTKEIIQEYEKHYPSIIKTIIQTENQYSKGIRILPMLAMPACKGSFFAICEGDDYWVNDEKVEHQIDFMIKNEGVMLTCHAAQVVDAKENCLITTLYPQEKSGNMSPHSVILGDGGLIPTPSIVVRSNIKNHIPKWWKEAHISDYPLVLSAILLGEIYAFRETWCAYSVNVENSWSTRTPNIYKTQIDHADRMNKILNGFADDCPEKYKYSAKVMISEYYFTALVRTKDTKNGKLLKFIRVLRNLIWVDKILIGLNLTTNLRVGWIRNFFMKKYEA